MLINFRDKAVMCTAKMYSNAGKAPNANDCDIYFVCGVRPDNDSCFSIPCEEAGFLLVNWELSVLSTKFLRLPIFYGVKICTDNLVCPWLEYCARGLRFASGRCPCIQF